MKTRGFTLIELLVVIVLLGVLAARAMPKFYAVETDARARVLENVAGAMVSTAQMVNAKAVIQNITGGEVELENLGVAVTVKHGYVTSHWNNNWTHILDVGKPIPHTHGRDICTINALCGVGNQNHPAGFPEPVTGRGRITIVWPEGLRIDDMCYAYYHNREDGTPPTTGTVIQGC